MADEGEEPVRPIRPHSIRPIEEQERKGRGIAQNRDEETMDGSNGLSQENGSDGEGGERSAQQGEEEVEGVEEGQFGETDGAPMGRARTLKTPKGPTQQQREEHEATHTPYQAWCRACVRGRGKNCPHRRVKGEKGTVNRVMIDYFFMTEEDKRASENQFLVMVDEETGENTHGRRDKRD